VLICFILRVCVTIVDSLSVPLWIFGNGIQSQRVPPPGGGGGGGGFDDCAGTLAQPSSDLSMIVSGGGSLPLEQFSGDHAPRLPPLALMRDGSGIDGMT